MQSDPSFEFSQGFYVPAVMDAIITVYSILYSNRSIGFDREMSRLDAARLGLVINLKLP